MACAERHLAQHRQRGRLAAPVAGLTGQGQGLTQATGGLLVAALPEVDNGEPGEGESHSWPVIRPAEQGQRPLVMVNGQLVAAMRAAYDADIAKGVSLPGPVVGLAGERQGLAKVTHGLLPSPLQHGGLAEAVQFGRLRTAISSLSCRATSIAVDDERFWVVAAKIQ